MPVTTNGSPARTSSVIMRAPDLASTSQAPSAPTPSDDTLVLEGSRAAAARMFGILVVTGALGAHRLTSRVDEVESGWLVVVGVTSLVILLGLAYLGYKAVRPGIAIVLDAEGLVHNASLIKPGRVRWSEIASAEVCEYGQIPYLRICLRDPKAFLRRQPAWKRALLRPLRSGSSPVEIPETLLPISVEELREMLVQRGVRRG